MNKDPLIGKKFGSYQILSELGRGGMGVVYRAMHRKLQRVDALKVLPHELVKGNPRFVERFEREARAVAQLVHQNVVQVYDADEIDGHHYIAMQFIEGQDLRQIIIDKSPLSEIQALEILVQAARGLGSAQKLGVIHRDIKPANLMIAKDGVLKIADFGLAKNTEEMTELTLSGQIMGTPAYMSPEQASGEELDFRSDMYSLGVCLFEMLSGRKPYISNTPIGLIKKHCLDPVPDIRELSPRIDEHLSSMILKMMAKDPGDRHDSYDKLISHIETVRRGIESRGNLEIDRTNTLSDFYPALLDVDAATEHPSETGKKRKKKKKSKKRGGKQSVTSAPNSDIKISGGGIAYQEAHPDKAVSGKTEKTDNLAADLEWQKKERQKT